MTTEERDDLILEFGRFREQNQREHGETNARIEKAFGEANARAEARHGEAMAKHGEAMARIEAQDAKFERTLRKLLLQGIVAIAVAVGATVGAVGLIVTLTG